MGNSTCWGHPGHGDAGCGGRFLPRVSNSEKGEGKENKQAVLTTSTSAQVNPDIIQCHNLNLNLNLNLNSSQPRYHPMSQFKSKFKSKFKFELTQISPDVTI